MTGQKDRYSTQEKLWKIDDEQLATPKHDELVLKLFDLDVVCKLFDFDAPDKPNITILSEVPIVSMNGFIIGYWDIIILLRDPLDDSHIEFFIEVKPEVVSFGTTLRQIKTYMQYLNPKNLLLKYSKEDLVNYRNLGEVIENERKRNVYLFTPDLKYKGAFENQGIKVISP